MTHGLILGFKYCSTDHVVFIKGLEIPGYASGSGVSTHPLGVALECGGRPRKGWDRLPTKRECAVPPSSAGEVPEL